MNTNIPQAYYACYVIPGLYKTAMKIGQEVNRNAVIVIHQPMFYTSSQIKKNNCYNKPIQEEWYVNIYYEINVEFFHNPNDD